MRIFVLCLHISKDIDSLPLLPSERDAMKAHILRNIEGNGNGVVVKYKKVEDLESGFFVIFFNPLSSSYFNVSTTFGISIDRA